MIKNTIKAQLPSFFSFNTPNDLIRIGRNFDGGYLVSKSDIDRSEILIGLGINDDWSFEEDFLHRKKVDVFAYDASVNERYFFKQLIKSVIRIDNIKLLGHWLKVILKYRRFFSQKNVRHIQKFVGLNSENKSYCTFEDVLNKIDNDKIFLKIDIEGSEYRFLDDIVKNEDRITGMVIEFHDCDIHLQEIEGFINKFSLKLVHIHANNFSPIRKDDDLPLVLELTFSKYADTFEKIKLPHQLDMRNNKYFSEVEISVNKCL
jgi:hypothetical protein